MPGFELLEEPPGRTHASFSCVIESLTKALVRIRLSGDVEEPLWVIGGGEQLNPGGERFHLQCLEHQ